MIFFLIYYKIILKQLIFFNLENKIFKEIYYFFIFIEIIIKKFQIIIDLAIKTK